MSSYVRSIVFEILNKVRHCLSASFEEQFHPIKAGHKKRVRTLLRVEWLRLAN